MLSLRGGGKKNSDQIYNEKIICMKMKDRKTAIR